MVSTFHSLEVSKRSLFTQQTALNTTGHNIANANTAGYSRQRVNMVAARPIEAPGFSHSTAKGQLGMGVEYDSITRIREQFLDEQFRNENKSLGEWSLKFDTLDKLEAIVNEPSDTGFRTVLDKFWNAWSELSKNPESTTGKKIIRETAQALTDEVNGINKRLGELKTDLTTNVGVKASQANSIISTIANLNGNISRIEGQGDLANDLRDQRDLLADELSKIMNIQVVNGQGGYSISMGGELLVEGAEVATQLTVESLEGAFGSGDLQSGEVYGMIFSRDNFVTDYENQLSVLINTMVNGEVEVTLPAGSVLPNGSTLVTSDGNTITITDANRTLTSDLNVKVNGINGLHKLGYVQGTPPTAAQDFFVLTTGNDGKFVLDISQAIKDDPNQIATSIRTTGTGTDENIVVGNDTLASLMANLKNSSFIFDPNADKGSTVGDYFNSIVGQLGVQTQEAARQTQHIQSLVDQVDSRRQSVSGVSLDEEMSDMIKFQHAYSAAARYMTTFDELLDKLINGTGVVGR